MRVLEMGGSGGAVWGEAFAARVAQPVSDSPGEAPRQRDTAHDIERDRGCVQAFAARFQGVDFAQGEGLAAAELRARGLTLDCIARWLDSEGYAASGADS